MARRRGGIEIGGEDVVWGAGAFLASLVVGVALVPFRGSIGLENVAIVYLTVVALASAVGGRAAELVAALSAALSYNWFFTTPYYTLRIDSVSQVVTVVLLFAAGLLASLGGRANRRAGARVREDEDAIRALHAISQAAAAGDSPDRVAAEQLLALVDARAVQVVRDEEGSDQVVAAAGEPAATITPWARRASVAPGRPSTLAGSRARCQRMRCCDAAAPSTTTACTGRPTRSGRRSGGAARAGRTATSSRA